MSVESALNVWGQLAQASPHGCRIHLTGGEPFGDWPRLIEICRQAYKEGLSSAGGKGPLEKVETNAFWASSPQIVRDRVKALADAGMKKLAISADPYHQQFVPIQRCRLAAEVAAEVLGASGVQVRWRDWLDGGFDTAAMSDAERTDLFTSYAAHGRDRFNGRAADMLGAPELTDGRSLDWLKSQVHNSRPVFLKSAHDFADMPCRETLLRGRSVHVDGSMRVMPGTCAGIVLGQLAWDWAAKGGKAGAADVSEVWRSLAQTYADRPVVGTLAQQGPCGLLKLAEPMGFVPQKAYAGKCHLCWDIRCCLARQDFPNKANNANGSDASTDLGKGFLQELEPAWLYARQQATV
jgi:hypothetical protein